MFIVILLLFCLILISLIKGSSNNNNEDKVLKLVQLVVALIPFTTAVLYYTLMIIAYRELGHLPCLKNSEDVTWYFNKDIQMLPSIVNLMMIFSFLIVLGWPIFIIISVAEAKTFKAKIYWVYY